MNRDARPLTVLSLVRAELDAKIAAAMPDATVVSVSQGGDLPADAHGEVLLSYPWSTPHLATALRRGVHWVHALGTGIDAFPVQILDGRTFTCSRGGSAVPIAEWTLAVMLAFEKRLPESWIEAPPPKGWNRAALGTLAGKTLGLVGLGGIAIAVAERALAFGMRVRAHRRRQTPAPRADIEIATSLADLVADADHIVLAAPATPATRHLFNRDVLARVKPGAHLVNIARGALIDAEALRAALDDGRIARASLDAVEPEPLPAGHWMYTHPGVRLSPHVSWSAPDAADRLLEPFIENLRRYRNGEPLLGIVDVEAGY